MKKSILITATLLLLIFLQKINAQSTVTIRNNQNNVPITEVSFDVYDNSIGGYVGEVQTAPASSNSFVTDLVNLKSVKINDNGTPVDLKYFNLGGTISNNNFTAATQNVFVYEDGVSTQANSGAAFDAAVNKMCNDSNMLNMLCYDGVISTPTGFDFDINWDRGLLADDYVVLGERNGNSTFLITALDAAGNVIPTANVLRFRATYDWNTGYAPGNVTGQAIYLTAVKVAQFNAGVPVHGFRIDNTNNADIRFFLMGDNSFDDNPRAFLPITLTNFDATTENRDVRLKWTTETEVNGDYFEIQHSADGVDFEVLDYVDAVGNSTDWNAYQYIHEGAGAGNHYYKLRMVDNDETYEYSHLVVASMDKINHGSTINIFPNPAPNKMITLAFDNDAAKNIQIVNVSGQVLFETTITSDEEQLNLSDLSAGIYFVKITFNNQERISKKLLLGY